jgi:UDPglucose--hexose-1-phosphate uridylyltransferase
VIEKNPITGDPLLLAPERHDRPNAFRDGIDRCPFCPGHESDTPAEIWRDGDPWRVRVFPNKYPATEHHEVIVETPDHAASFDRLTPGHAALAVDTYISRYYSGRDAGYVALFKNHGAAAGASIPHAHSQLIATQFLPKRIARESIAFISGCPLCDLDEHPLIAETPNYRWIAPRGSSFAYEQRIVPKRHEAEMREGLELAALLQRSARAMLSISDSFNWIFINFPQQPKAHWYVQLLPRIAVYAGFEIGTGSAINTIDPEDAARRIAAASRP